MTGKLALPTLIALCSIALGKPTQGSLVVLGEISISGTMIKVDELANALQVCLDSMVFQKLYTNPCCLYVGSITLWPHRIAVDPIDRDTPDYKGLFANERLQNVRIFS